MEVERRKKSGILERETEEKGTKEGKKKEGLEGRKAAVSA